MYDIKHSSFEILDLLMFITCPITMPIETCRAYVLIFKYINAIKIDLPTLITKKYRSTEQVNYYRNFRATNKIRKVVYFESNVIIWKLSEFELESFYAKSKKKIS